MGHRHDDARRWSGARRLFIRLFPSGRSRFYSSGPITTVVAGASLIGDGRMALILDVDALYRTGVKAPTRLIA